MVDSSLAHHHAHVYPTPREPYQGQRYHNLRFPIRPLHARHRRV